MSDVLPSLRNMSDVYTAEALSEPILRGDAYKLAQELSLESVAYETFPPEPSRPTVVTAGILNETEQGTYPYGVTLDADGVDTTSAVEAHIGEYERWVGGLHQTGITISLLDQSRFMNSFRQAEILTRRAGLKTMAAFVTFTGIESGTHYNTFMLPEIVHVELPLMARQEVLQARMDIEDATGVDPFEAKTGVSADFLRGIAQNQPVLEGFADAVVSVSLPRPALVAQRLRAAVQ